MYTVMRSGGYYSQSEYINKIISWRNLGLAEDQSLRLVRKTK